MFSNPIKFSMRKVEDIRDGYVELLQDVRYPIENIEKKRVDVSVQAAPSISSSETQTTLAYPVNMATQYEFDYESTKPSKDTKAKLPPKRTIVNIPLTFTNADSLLEKVFFNEHINIYKDDYADLNTGERFTADLSGNLERFITCSEPNQTKGKLVADCAWSYFTSGILAACYSDFESSCLSYRRSEYDAIADQGAPPVLIWCYTDGLEPKLFLETPREVTYLTWCPYQKDLLIGGTINGQVIVWDLTNKIEEVETPEILTSAQKEHRSMLLRNVQWMKITRKASIVQPFIISNLNFSHKSTVSFISWLPYNCEVTKQGKYKFTENPIGPNQFITTSEDGTLLIWKLNIKSESTTERRKSRRLIELPNVFKANKLNHKELCNNFKPHYKVTINKLPLLTMKKLFHGFCTYEPIDNYEDPRPQFRTEYRLSQYKKVSTENIRSQVFLVGTTTGKLFEAKTEGYDFDAGTILNSEEAKTTSFNSVHDGPITHIELNSVCEDFLLTTGGTIFAIWSKVTNIPVFWRKATHGLKYLNGGWVMKKPSHIIMIRSDGTLEIWDLLINLKEPIRTVTMGGDLILKTFGFLTPVHCRKGTMAFSDNLGTLTFYHVPDLMVYQSKTEQASMQALLDRLYETKQIMNKWINKYEEEFYRAEKEVSKFKVDSIIKATSNAKKPKIESNIYFSQIDRMNKIFGPSQWKTLHEQHMFETIMSRKHLNLKELENFKNIIVLREKEEGEKMFKKQTAIINKKNTFEVKSTGVLEGRKFLKTSKRYETLTHHEDETLVADYEAIEEAALHYITSHKFIMKNDWSKTLLRERRLSRQIIGWLKLKKQRPAMRAHPILSVSSIDNFAKKYIDANVTHLEEIKSTDENTDDNNN